MRLGKASNSIRRVARTVREDIIGMRDHGNVPPYREAFKPHMAGAMQDRALEWFSALAMLGWGMVLAMPGDTTSQPAFSAFRHYGTSEDFWAAIFSILGAARLVALFINGRWPRTPIVRMIGALFGAMTWAQIAYMLTEASLFGQGIFSTGTIIYSLLALADMFSIYRASFDARYYRN